MENNDSEVLLNELLDQADDEIESAFRASSTAAPSVLPEGPAEEKKKKPDTGSHTQWALGGNGKFMPVGSTVANLKPGVYQPFANPGEWGVELISVMSDGLYHLPDMSTEVVLSDVRRFWDSEPKYRKHNLLYKRGILMWGPPGSGKTVAVKLLMKELVDAGGIVIIGFNVQLTQLVLKAVKRIEPDRNLIVVFEDIDEIIQFNGEANVLSLLDGEGSIDRVLNLATTNYPERLGARIINRPSRFDRRVHVGMPSDLAREVYLDKTTNGELAREDLTKWTRDTKEMSIAHLRELVAAVYCLEQPYDEVIKRLKDMAQAPTAESGFKDKKLGFGNVKKESW